MRMAKTGKRYSIEDVIREDRQAAASGKPSNKKEQMNRYAESYYQEAEEKGLGVPRVESTRQRKQNSVKQSVYEADDAKKEFDAAGNKAMSRGKRARAEAKKASQAYTDYVQSEEGRKGQVEAAQETRNRIFAGGDAAYGFTKAEDEKEKELRNRKEYWDNQVRQEEDSKLANRDLSDIRRLSPEEQRMLERYAAEKESDYLDSLNPAQNGIRVGNAQKNAKALIDKYGQQRIDELAETYSRVKNAGTAEKVQQAAVDNTAGGFWKGMGQSAVSVGANVTSGIPGVLSYMRELGQRTGRYSTLDPNNAGAMPGVYAEAVRGQVQREIEGENGENGFLGKLGSILYQGGMSAADSGARALTGGVGNMVLAATGTFTSTVREASARGASPAQAVALGTVDAAVDALTEKIPLDNLLDVAKGGKQTAMEIVVNALKQAGIEITTEEASLVGSTLADAAILREKSEYNQAIGEAMANGMTYQQAKNAANMDILAEAVNTALVSGISGAGMSAVNSLKVNRIIGNAEKAGAQQGQSGDQAAQTVSTGTAQDTAKTGQEQAQGTQEDRFRNQLYAKMNQIGAEANSQALEKGMASYLENGRVTNKPADAIAADPEAVRYLQGKTGVSIEGTATQKRNAVRAAVESVLGVNTESVDSAENQTYNGSNQNQGGNNNAGAAGTEVTAPAGAELHGTAGEGVRAVQSGAEPYSRSSEYGVYGQGNLRGSGELLLSDAAQKALADRGSPNVPMDACTDAQAFKNALDEGRNSDVKNGWCVSPKELSDLTEPGAKMYLSRNGEAGFVINDGDIEAVFTNKAKGAPKGLADSLMLRAISAGGNKLDCYGEVLATLYSKYGFEPVAKVAFNQEYANPGWNPSKGEPYIYVMKHNGDSVDTVAGKLGTYQSATKAQLDDLPTFGKNDYDKAMAYRDSLMGKNGTQQEDTVGQSVGGGQEGDIAKSRTYTNPGSQNGKKVQMAYKKVLAENPEAGDYQVKHQADTLKTAQDRVSTPEKVQAEYQNLMGKDVWDADDVATANLLQDRILRSGDPDAARKFADFSGKKQETMTKMGQAINAAQIKERGMKNAETTATAVDSFISSINSMEQSSTTYNEKKAGKDFADWKKDLCTEATRIGIAIESVEDGDAASMREIIRQIARKRKTTAFFGRSDKLTANARRILNKLDFDTLKKIANTQVAAMPDDFRGRSAKEVAMGIRKNSMLSSIKTFARNIGGNMATGVFDPFSEGTSGRIADMLLSKFTGVKTIGNEFNQAGTWIRSSRDAADFSALCVELDIPIETDADASFAAASAGNQGGKYVGKTFRPTGNPAMRFMYAYQKYMSYALEVSDKIFEGGSNAAVTQSLQNMEASGLNGDDVQRIAAYTANRRTFKDATFTDSDGKTKGSQLSRAAQAMKRGAGEYFGAAGEIAGDIAMPFAGVPMNVQQTGIDYTAGTVKAVAEIAGIIRDVKAGKQIDPVRQRNAASDFGRGVTGTGMIALFTAAAATGALKVSNAKDKDEKALAQAEGRSGAQLNWSAMLRGMKGESTDWQDGDAISSLDFLEPFNTLMYLGYELAQEDSVTDMVKAYPTAAFNSVLNSVNDSPMMTGLTEIEDLISDVSSAETMTDKVYEAGGYLGDVASTFIPQFVRQTAQYSDGYYRDTRGANAMEYAANNIKAAIPGLSKTLPVKYSGLGEPQKRGGFLETFVDPTMTHSYRANDVFGYLEQLSQRTGDKAVFPDYQAPMSIKVDGETVNLDGAARETYQKTYGEAVNSYYTGLMENGAFDSLPDDVKLDALKRAESYATEQAKAAVSDYKTDLTTDREEVVKEIIGSSVEKGFSGAFDALKRDGVTGEVSGMLDSAYEVYSSLDKDSQKAFLEDNGGRIGYFIKAKEKGIDTDTFGELYGTYRDLGEDGTKTVKDKAQEWSYALTNARNSGKITKAQESLLKSQMVFRSSYAVGTEKYDEMLESGLSARSANYVAEIVNKVVGTGKMDADTGKRAVTDYDKWWAITTSTGITDRDKDTAVKAYMPDYDPTAKSKNYIEVKYDYAREELGVSPSRFVQLYHAYQEGDAAAEKKENLREIVRDEAMVNQLYNLFNGKSNKEIARWYSER